MRARIGLAAVVTCVAAAFVLSGCGKKDEEKPPPPPVEKPVKKDLGPNSCDLRTTKKLCMEYTGANSTAEDVETNCAGWEESVFLEGNCPAGGLAVCTQVLGPSKVRMIFFEGSDMATEEQACKENGHAWEVLPKPKAPAPAPKAPTPKAPAPAPAK